MKIKMIGLSLAVFIAGCSAAGPMENIIRDQQFNEYKTNLDDLERLYLQKKISYADYLEKKKTVEDDYQKEIDGRRDIIQNQPQSKTVSEMTP